MLQLIKTEINLLKNEIRRLDVNVVTILVTSTMLLTVSWYFSNPEFFNEVFTFHNTLQFEIGELVSFSYWFILDTFLLLLLPIFIIAIVLKEKTSDFGLNIKNKEKGFFFIFWSIIFFIPIIFLVSKSQTFLDYFPLMQSSIDDYRIFIIYEILFIIFIFSWEFIFRGFILFGLEKKFGLYAIFIQMIPFVLLHNGKPFIETFSSILGAIFLGYLAIRTRSIFYGFLIHAIILISLDIIAYWTV